MQVYIQTLGRQIYSESSDMPDPILPAVGITISAIGLLFTVRNGIDLILRDKDKVADIVEDLLGAQAQISLLEDRLIIWKRFWSIYDGIPFGHFITLWGRLGADEIHNLLASTEHLSRAMSEDFESKYGARRIDALSHQIKGISESDRLTMIRKIIASYKKEFKLGKRIRLALFYSPTFQRHLDALKSRIDDLDALSTSSFQINHPYAYDEQASKALGLQTVLTELRDKAAKSTVKIIDCCRRRELPENMAIDFLFDLAYKSESKLRYESLHHRATQAGYPYYLRIVNDTGLTDGNHEILLKSELDFENRFKKLLARLGETKAESRCPIPGSKNSPRQYNRLAPLQKSESLKWILSESPLKLGDSDYHSFSRAERYKVAYELSELALILLASSQLRDLCICGVQRVCVDAAEAVYQHLIRINNIHEFNQRSNDAQEIQRWCRTKLLNMHILRLGIVLAEISIGSMVEDATYDTEAGMVKMTFVAPGENPREMRDCTPDVVARVVKESAGEDLSRIVLYCLRRDVRYDQITKGDCESFYNWVVAP